MNFTPRNDLHVEVVDDGYLILVPGRDEVVHLRSADAEAFALARRGVDEVPATLTASMAGLVELGLVTTNAWDRRKVLALGGASAAATVAVIALPSVAAAASPPGNTGPTTTPGRTGSVTAPTPTNPPGHTGGGGAPTTTPGQTGGGGAPTTTTGPTGGGGAP